MNELAQILDGVAPYVVVVAVVFVIYFTFVGFK